MTFLRYLAKNISVLNVLLAAVMVVLLVYALFPIFSIKALRKPQRVETKLPASAATETQTVQAPFPADYAIVVQNNIFHPERKIPPEKKEEAELPKPELILYGTMITGDVNIAYVEDKKAPYTTQGRGKRQRVLKKGDLIGGFILKEIETNRITLVRNGEVLTFKLDTEKERDEAPRPGAGTSAIQRASTASAALSPVVPLRKTPPPPEATIGVTSRQLPALRTQIKQ